MERYTEVDEVIAYIRAHLDEPLPLARLAGHVAYSPYHFTRIFKDRTGLSPLYYVAALRLQKAKDLLLRTNLGIRDVGLEIGQQSLGTFTTRFTERVGVSPSEFRHSARLAETHVRSLQQLSDWRSEDPIFGEYGCVEGTIGASVPFDGFVLIGLFAKPIPEGLPPYGTLLASPGYFRFTGVRPGTYYLMATSVSWSMNAMDILLPHTTLRTRTRTPIRVQPGISVPYQQPMLYEPKADDPPILISLPLLMNIFLSRTFEPARR